MSLPDFLIIGSPKAGSTALHAALSRHPQLYASRIKEPKYFLCDGSVPPAPRGPGDAHSVREWMHDRSAYERLFDAAPPGALAFESTPFYLWSHESHRRIAANLPEAKLIAVIRDPVDRAFSNWSHLRADGLEPERDFVTACLREPNRIANGWAPFWRYLELGRYGEQLGHLFAHVPRERVAVVRYRRLIEDPAGTLDDLCRFLGVATGVLTTVPESNVGRWADDNAANDLLRRLVTLGSAAGSHVDPRVWRRAERSLLRVLHRGNPQRPTVTTEQRTTLISRFAEDNALLCRLLEDGYSDWLSPVGRGAYTVRRSCEPSELDASK